METMESCVPPGFRFHPTDEELVGYYLRKKVASQKIDLDVIRDIDLYRIEPWDLRERCRIGYEEQNESYFFSHKDKKYPTGTRTNRATMAGFWKATGRDKAVYDKAKLVGMRKTLVFYKGRAPNGQKTDWIMHEYRLESDENGPPQEEGWVVCRAFKKRIATNGQTKNMDGWDPSYYLYDEPSGVGVGVGSMSDPIDHYLTSQLHHQNLLSPNINSSCKRETLEADNPMCFMNSDSFLQLPQLDSPSLPFIKRPGSVSLMSENDYVNYGDDERALGFNNTAINSSDFASSRDWRDLDKFVASQLSQDQDGCDVDGASSGTFGGGWDNNNNNNNNNNSEVPWLILQSREEGDRFDGFLSSSSGCDVGICVFEK